MKNTANHDAGEVAAILSKFAPEFTIAKHELIRSFVHYFARKDPFGFNRSKFIAKCVGGKRP